MFLLSYFLKRLIKSGTLNVIDVRGRTHVFLGTSRPSVTVRLNSRFLPLRLLLNPDLCLGEAYMNGQLGVEDGTIYGLLDLFASNLGSRRIQRGRRLLCLLEKISGTVRRFNSVRRSRRNVAHHYDLSGEFYDLFLDHDRQYSCAYFAQRDDELELAQARKRARIAAKLRLEPGQKVLDIGCGWGGLALDLSRTFGAEVTGITLSQEQLEAARERAQTESLDDHVDFRMQDYRKVDEVFDRIVSVGMFEHVGAPHYPAFFRILTRALANDGVALLHTIGRAHGPGATSSWLRKYIFPGGYIPALSEILPAIEHAGLFVTDVEVMRLHYAETIKAWRERFDENRSIVELIYDERFRRMWEFYLAMSEVAFRRGGFVVFQIQLAKQQDAVPLTRSYLAEAETQMTTVKRAA